MNHQPSSTILAAPKQPERGYQPTTPTSAEQSRAREQAGLDSPNANIARLPKETRDMINVMLADGVPHHILIEELAEAGEGLNAQSLTDWVQGRYQDYLAHREDVEQAKSQLEFATDLIRELGEGDPTLIYRACNVLVAHQIFKSIREFGDEALRDMLRAKPSSYLNLLNTLCNMVQPTIDLENHRIAFQKAGATPPAAQGKMGG